MKSSKTQQAKTSTLKNMPDSLHLPRVTYVGFLLRDVVDANNSVDKVLKIGYETSKGINFGRKVMYTAQKPNCETYDFDIVEIEPQPWHNYTNWLSKNSANMFDTEFMVNFHADGMIQNRAAWTDEFYNYDYIGAPWDSNSNGGNGGFNLRSKRLCSLLSEIDMSPHTPQKTLDDAEDVLISRVYADYLTSKGIKFCPLDISCRFSTEHYSLNGMDGFKNSFGFHEIDRLFDDEVKKHRESFVSRILDPLPYEYKTGSSLAGEGVGYN